MIKKINFKRKNFKDILADIIICGLIFLGSVFIFKTIYWYSDLYLHAEISERYIQSKENIYLKNFLYYILIQIFSLGNKARLFDASVYLLSIFVVLKYIVVNYYLGSTLKNGKLFSILLLIIFPIYLPQLIFNRAYLGSFTPNVWHNSTTIAVFPFAILLFGETIKQLNKFCWLRLCVILGLILVNAMFKPSFLFVYIVALPLTYLISKQFSLKDFLRQLLPSVFSAIVICFQKLAVYLDSSDIYAKSSIAISPFYVYANWLGDVPIVSIAAFFTLSVITSLAYPLLVLIAKGLKKQDSILIFAWVGMLIALIIGIMFVETGIRLEEGNFFWQAYICSFILFMVSVFKTHGELSLKYKKINKYQVLFFLHVIFGLFYIARLFFREKKIFYCL
jgi:hypothetical protein